jgi:dihydroorotase
MNALIKQAIIIDAASPYNGKAMDILITDGIISQIATDIAALPTHQIIQQNDLHISIGWMDIFAHFTDPGLEYRETIQSGAAAAAAGGFTDVLLLPNTKPTIDTKAQVEYITQKSINSKVNLHPIGAVTKNTDGKDLAEMYDMRQSGAVAFSDGINAIQSSGLLLKALQYVKAFDGVIIQIPDDSSIGANGLMHEGIISTQLGLPGKPAMAEELMVANNLKLARYAESKIHFTGVASAKSLAYIQRSKETGIQVTCSVTPYHLFFTDADLQQYDTNLKVHPPIRTKQDQLALLQGLADGTIDCIASHHLPHNYDGKICEFEYAKNGMIGLETMFGVLGTLVNETFTLPQLINILTIAPRQIFNLPLPTLLEGSVASLTLFNPNSTYQFNETMIASKSSNTPFIGKTLKGKVVGIIHKNELTFNT